jgi:hypothetical protein
MRSTRKRKLNNKRVQKRKTKRKTKKMRKYGDGNKPEKVKKIIKIFQQYPDIFPRGYFKFLPATIEKHMNNKTLQYKKGVVLTWTEYKKTVKKSPKCIILPGDIKINQLVNKKQGNGAAKKVFLDFLKKHNKKTLWLEVRKDNKRAIRFYKKNNFKKICETKFGDIRGILMKKKKD